MTDAAIPQSADPHGDYMLCRWRVSSPFPLPELPVWSGGERTPDLTITIGPAPAFDAPRLATPVLTIDGSGRGRFHIASVATFLIDGGRRITIEPHIPLHSSEIRLFLLGTPFGLICHQRGLVPLHAAAVEVDGEAVALAGPSGVGKSTLAAAFLRRGHRILSDDVAPFEFTDQGAVLLPSLCRIRLWRDSIAAAGWNVDSMERCRAGLEKFSHPLDGQSMAGPLRPRALIHLTRKARSAGGVTFRRMRGSEASEWVRRQVYRARSLGGVAGEEALVTRATRMAAAIPYHFLLARPFNFDELDRTVDIVVDTIRGMR